jgi:hypothetical protein
VNNGVNAFARHVHEVGVEKRTSNERRSLVWFEGWLGRQIEEPQVAGGLT